MKILEWHYGNGWNEFDEFWGEKLIVSKPTGENKQAPVQIIVIAISSVAVIGVGIILIKKFVLTKDNKKSFVDFLLLINFQAFWQGSVSAVS